MDSTSLSRRRFLWSSVLAGAAAGALPQHGRSAERLRLPSFEFGEITVASLQAGMKSGEFTAQYIAERYLSRIHAIDKNGPCVNAGFVLGLPVNISFFGRAYSEPVLLKLAYAFEQATAVRRPPPSLASADLQFV